MSARFNIKAADPEAVTALERELHMPRFIAATLVARGIDTPEAANRFLTPSIDRDWLDPYTIPGLSDVADALEAAIKRGDHVMVFGDFDLDGISATTVMTRGLRGLGAKVTPFIPRRFDEGYAITPAAIERLMQVKPDFLVTVDCGIACRDEVRTLRELGVEVAITDHHEPSGLVPEDVPVADPKCHADCASSILAGVGVALKTIQVLGARFGRPHMWRNLIDIATLGTIADLMPMRDENRALVAEGLRMINETPRPCLYALLQTSGALEKQVTATNLSFSLIPRLNAAGRMGDAELALRLLLADDYVQASKLAEELETVNGQRRAIEAELSEIAKVQAAEIYHGQRALVVAGEGWHEGVKGIVASRLVSTYGVPTLLFTIDGDQARGSGRSVGQVNLFKAVESCSDLLIRFGGHGAAVGVTLATENLPEFERRLCEYMDALPEGAFHPLINIDACVDLGELTLRNVAQLDALAPFGQEHPVPVYLARDVTLLRCRAVGAERNHFSCSMSNGRSIVAGIMFHCNNIKTLMACDSVVNAAFEVQIDEWRNRRSVKAMLKSISPTRTCAGLEACLCPESQSFVADLYAAPDEDLVADAPHDPDAIEEYENTLEKNRAEWEAIARQNPAALTDQVVRAFIGDGKLHPAQRAILDNLSDGKSTLGVMVTGRGKSLTFQVHAALRALANHEASMFVYPLRALIADQAHHLREALSRFGITVATLTGESAADERRETFAGLRDGSIDIVLTTPEFLDWHADSFAMTGRVSFVVVDEAHHIGLAHAGQREAYAGIGRAVSRLGNPVVLALTATANDDCLAAIKRELPIQACVYDGTGRPNLVVDDRRDVASRDNYLANLVASGEKTVVFVNSRKESIVLARRLRKQTPQVAPFIGFYNAGLSRSERRRIEDLFRNDELLILIATSAFGEGVDIPNIRHVVMYHMPFNEIEFNQMAGRAGRDGQPACVHLLFGREDQSINDVLLSDMTPSRECMAQVYRKLRDIQRKSGTMFFNITDADLATRASTNLFPVKPAAATCAVAVFRELGLIEAHASYGPDGLVRAIHVRETDSKVELVDSVRYREGLDERAIFHDFRMWAMGSSAEELQGRVTHPILPADAEGNLVDGGEGEAGAAGGGKPASPGAPASAESANAAAPTAPASASDPQASGQPAPTNNANPDQKGAAYD